jgi:hypothetical protein
MADLTPTERTLTLLIRAAFPLGSAAMNSVDLRVSDWADLSRSAEQHGLAPLLYAALSTLGRREEPPPATLHQLQWSYLHALRAGADQYRELDHLLGLFDREQIPIVLLKGSVLAATLYADIAHRPMTDVDCLIHKSDLPRVTAILTARGYSSPHPDKASSLQRDFLGELAFVRSGQNHLVIDAHWHLFNLPYYVERIPISWFWQHTADFQLNGRRAVMLAPEAQLLHLASHFFVHHRGNGLRWSYDMALLLARSGRLMQWSSLAEAARRFGLAVPVQAALTGVESVWAVELPAGACEWLRAGTPTLRDKIVFAVAIAPIPDAVIVSNLLTPRGLRRQWSFLWAAVFRDRTLVRPRHGRAVRRLAPLHHGWRVVLGAYKLFRAAIAMAGIASRLITHEVLAAARLTEHR